MFSLLGLGIAVSCSLAFTTFDACRKMLVNHWPTVPLLAVLMLGQAILFFWVWVLLEQAQWPPIPSGYWGCLAATVVLNIVANGLFLVAVRVAPISYCVPMLSLTPLFSGVGSLWVLGETLSGMQWAGAAGIAVGTLGLALNANANKPAYPTPGQRPLLGMGLMALVALLFALCPVADKPGVQMVGSWLHGTLLFFGVGVFTVLFMGLRRASLPNRAAMKRTATPLVLGVASATASALLQFWAILLLPISVVEGIKRALGLVGAMVSGRLLFGERTPWRQWAWVSVLMLALWAMLFGG